LTGPPTSIVPIGKKAQLYFGRRKHPVHRNAGDFWVAFSHPKAAELASEIAAGFLAGEYDQVDLLYNEFVSVITQRPKKVTLLPLKATEGTKTAQADYLYEPGRETVVRALVPKAMEVRFYVPCLNSLASEFGARMTAMDSASRNAGEMIDTLTLSMNRIRQAQITKDLSEIVTSAEAMK
ncbi:MAG: FoF1 ATP synthase subunit gamma, partial [Pseudomonadota bacterium]